MIRMEKLLMVIEVGLDKRNVAFGEPYHRYPFPFLAVGWAAFLQGKKRGYVVYSVIYVYFFIYQRYSCQAMKLNAS